MFKRSLPTLLFALCIASLTSLVLGALPLRDHTVWWGVGLGRWIEAFGAIPNQNTMTFGASPGAPLIVLPWLAHLASFKVHLFGLIEAVLTMRNVLAGLSAGIAVVALRIGSLGRLTMWPLLLGFALVVSTYGATSLMWATPLWAISLLAVQTLWRTRSLKGLVAAPLVVAAVAALWPNLDLSWMMLPGLCLVAALRPGETPRPNRIVLGVLALVAALLPGLVHPLGWAIYPYSVETLLLYPNQTVAGPGWSLVGVNFKGLLWAVGLLWTGWSVFKAPRERREEAIYFGAIQLAMAALAAFHMRAMVSWGLVMIAFGAPWLIEHTKITVDLGRLKLSRLAVVTAVMLLLATLAQPMLVTHNMTIGAINSTDTRDRMPHQGVVPNTTPIEAVELLAQYRAPPRIWATPKLEGYIQYRLNTRYPDAITYSTPAIEMMTDAQRKLQEMVRSTPDLWRGIFQQYKIEAVLLLKDEDAALVDQITAHPKWHISYEDSVLVYLIKEQ